MQKNKCLNGWDRNIPKLTKPISSQVQEFPQSPVTVITDRVIPRHWAVELLETNRNEQTAQATNFPHYGQGNCRQNEPAHQQKKPGDMAVVSLEGSE